ncbi:Btf3l4 protein [Capsaspora owczarzaki ATCC 30864]|nr:Btf3l4 protein [Capsaspora owczarzaki ATCC 30864]|eukprot:XP_004365391.1 Btf3l4 protein [Capsaspora owczarzaki ATCC 30864]
MDNEKLAKLQALHATARLGGKGTPRRKKKVVHKTAAADDKKIQTTLRKLQLTDIPAVEEVLFFLQDKKVMAFRNPKVQAALPSNTFAITGTPATKDISEMLPQLLEQLGGGANMDNITQLLKSRMAAGGAAGGDDDVPDLVENFDEAKDKTPDVE